MKQPVWMLNSSLLVLFCISQLLLFMMQRVVPRRVSISPGAVVVVEEQANDVIDIKTIYEHDLFNTYEPPVTPIRSVVDDTIPAMPRAPKIIVPEIPVEKSPTFFAPLDVVLKGVIFVKDDPANCIAIVQLKKTKEERNYQVGDLIEDSQVLKILSNRIIIIRSNGQQETLYLREEDAIFDFNAQATSAPKSIIENVSDNKYTINIDEFSKKIHNLGEFINVLDLTTVYKQGKSFGCRIGRIEKDSIGSLLGLVMDDVIVKVDHYFVDDLASRLQLYDHVVQKRAGDTIEVVLYRGQDTIVLQYGLVDTLSKNITFTPQETKQKLMEELSKHEAAILSAQSSQVMIQTFVEEDIDDVDTDIDFVENDGDVAQDDVMDFAEHFNDLNNFDDQDTVVAHYTTTTNQRIGVIGDDHKTPEYQKINGMRDLIRQKEYTGMGKSSRNVILNGMQ